MSSLNTSAVYVGSMRVVGQRKWLLSVFELWVGTETREAIGFANLLVFDLLLLELWLLLLLLLLLETISRAI